MEKKKTITRSQSFLLIKPALTFIARELEEQLPELLGHRKVLDIIARSLGHSHYGSLLIWLKKTPLSQLTFRFDYEKLLNELRKYGCDEEMMEELYFVIFKSDSYLPDKRVVLKQGLTIETSFLHDVKRIEIKVITSESFQLITPALMSIVRQLKERLPGLSSDRKVMNIFARVWGYSNYEELFRWLNITPLNKLFFKPSLSKFFNELNRFGYDDSLIEEVYYEVFEAEPFLAEKKIIEAKAINLETFLFHDGRIKGVRGNREIAFEGFFHMLLRKRINICYDRENDEYYRHKRGIYATSFDFIDHEDVDKQYEYLQKFLNHFDSIDSNIPFLLANHLISEELREKLLKDKAWKYFSENSIYGDGYFMWKAEKALLKHADD